MASQTPQKVHQVAVILFNRADILDFAGPVEILTNTIYNEDILNPDNAFKIHMIASTPTIKAGDCMIVSADTTIDEARKRIEDYDVLVVPGGNPDVLEKLAKANSPETEFIKAFDTLNPKRQDGDERIMLSVCTGALLLGATGVLKGLKATTHHYAYDMLQQMDPTIEVLKTVGPDAFGRYVDSGTNGNGVRVVTAGGVTCGIDAALFVAELKAGRKAAEFQASVVEHEWKRV